MLKKRKQKISDEPTRQKPLRLWPGVVAVMLQWLVRFIIPIVVPGAIVIGVFGGLLGGLAVVVWWAFFSRAPRSERWGAIALMILAMVGTSRFLHVSIATAGQGMLFIIYAIPVLSLAFVVWAVASRRLANGPRRAECGHLSGPVALPVTPIRISRFGGRKLPRSGSWPKLATSQWRFRRLLQ